MADRKILIVGDEMLRKKCKPVVKFDDSLHELLDDMHDTMIDNDGAGLAAPQVGILRRLFVIQVNEMYIELINPKIIKTEGEKIDIEGCLSIPNKSGYVARPKTVTVEAQDRFGNEFTLTGSDMLAKAICHENDHLDGILYIDKVIEGYVPPKEKDNKNKKDKKE
jgi:peptide deformylase